MSEYHKIQTVFKRPQTGNAKHVLEGEYSTPEFAYLANDQWEFTEKVDGMNIRVIKEWGDLRFAGKTNKAHLPPQLLMRLNEMFSVDMLNVAFPDCPVVVLYGEGYGPGIQKGGGNYGTQQDFVLFDVLVDHWWLKRADVDDVARKLGIRSVPVYCTGTLHDMVREVKGGLVSTWGPFDAEGIVARPAVELRDRAGHRIITKLKTRDFPVA